ncbi:unnamed protein product [Chrysoparadoxa australica]
MESEEEDGRSRCAEFHHPSLPASLLSGLSTLPTSSSSLNIHPFHRRSKKVAVKTAIGVTKEDPFLIAIAEIKRERAAARRRARAVASFGYYFLKGAGVLVNVADIFLQLWILGWCRGASPQETVSERAVRLQDKTERCYLTVMCVANVLAELDTPCAKHNFRALQKWWFRAPCYVLVACLGYDWTPEGLDAIGGLESLLDKIVFWCFVSLAAANVMLNVLMRKVLERYFKKGKRKGRGRGRGKGSKRKGAKKIVSYGATEAEGRAAASNSGSGGPKAQLVGEPDLYREVSSNSSQKWWDDDDATDGRSIGGDEDYYPAEPRGFRARASEMIHAVVSPRTSSATSSEWWEEQSVASEAPSVASVSSMGSRGGAGWGRSFDSSGSIEVRPPLSSPLPSLLEEGTKENRGRW